MHLLLIITPRHIGDIVEIVLNLTRSLTRQLFLGFELKTFNKQYSVLFSLYKI